MLTYSSDFLLSMAFSSDIPPILRSNRKLLFSMRIWRPSKDRNPSSPKRPNITNNQIFFGLINARSAVNKAALLHDSICDGHLDLLAVTETWISADAPNAIKQDIAPPGFSVVHSHRPAKRGGGIAIIHKSSIRSAVLDLGTHTEFESLSLKISNSSSAMTIAAIYRPPGPITSSFFDQLTNFIDILQSKSTPFILCGDFNAPSNSNSINPHFSSFLQELNLIQHVQSSTHSHGNILDLIITPTTPDNLISNLRISDVNYSDHKLLTTMLNFSKPPTVTYNYFYRSLHRVDWALFEQDLSQLSNSLLLNCLNPHYLASSLDLKLSLLLNKHAPLKTVVRRKSIRNNYVLSHEALEAKRKCRRLERKFRRLGTAAAKHSFKTAKLAAKMTILRSRADFLKEELSNSTHNPRFLWRTAHKLLHSNPPNYYSDSKCKELVDSFSNFFSRKISQLHQSIAASLSSQAPIHYPNRHNYGESLSFFSDTNTAEILKLIHSLPNKTSPLDPVPISIIKKLSSIFCPILVRLANLSFQEGTFPDTFKTAQVLPLLKKSNLDPDNPANYRPISNLSTFSKLLERLVLQRLRNHISSNPNFSLHQSAYRPFHSTETALLHVMNDTYNACSNRNAVIMVSLDLSAAFDTISHDVLLNRLCTEFGLKERSLSWIESYLCNRKQFVKIGRHFSPTVLINAGVPQGSVLGPILFTTYTSPVEHIIDNYGIISHQYADDTHFHISITQNSLSSSLQSLADCSTDIYRWYLNNFLMLNPDKSEVLLVGTGQQLSKFLTLTSINIAGSFLPFSDSIKLLGVTIDSHLTFQNHISQIIKTCNYHIRAINHIRHLLTTDVASTLARCLILSKLDYCNSLLYNISPTFLGKLQSIQFRAAKSVLKPTKPTNSLALLAQLHWLPITSRINFKIAILTFKTLSTQSPPYLYKLISRHKHTKSLRLSSDNFLNIPVCKSKLANRSFSFAAPSVWNALPPHIRNCSSLAEFKKLLKTFYYAEVG